MSFLVVERIPAIFRLDRRGTIIASGLRSDEIARAAQAPSDERQTLEV